MGRRSPPRNKHYPTAPPHPPHMGNREVAVGSFSVLAAGTMYRGWQETVAPGTILVPLTDLWSERGTSNRVIWGVMEDFGGVPDGWEHFLSSVIIPELQSGHELLAFCAGSHGRTGTFLASLIALLEGPEETPDPIAAVRERHCHKSVETGAQASGIYGLRNQPVPDKYQHQYI